MTYALNAKIYLPFTMAGTLIATINIGRYTARSSAEEGKYDFMRREEVTTFDRILGILEEHFGTTLLVRVVIEEE